MSVRGTSATCMHIAALSEVNSEADISRVADAAALMSTRPRWLADLWHVTTISCLAVETDRTPRDTKYQYTDMLQHLHRRFRVVKEQKTQSSFPLLVCCLPI